MREGSSPPRGRSARPTRVEGPVLASLSFSLLLLLGPWTHASAQACGPGADDGDAGGDRAIWVWEEDSFELLDRARDWEAFSAFLSRNCISTVYLYADRYQGRDILDDEPSRYHAFLTYLHREGFEVYALLGSAYLRTQEYVLPERRAEAEAMLRSALTYNQSASGPEQFDGINVDVEPYLLDQWDEDREQIGRYYLELSRKYMEMKEAYGFRGTVGPAMPFWFDGITVDAGETSKTLSEQTQDLYDYVAIMAYRDRADGRDGIVRHVTDEIEYASSVGKRVVVGVETKSGDLDKVTFHEETRRHMEEELQSVADALREYPAFGGTAIHHYGSYRAWLEGQGSPSDP